MQQINFNINTFKFLFANFKLYIDILGQLGFSKLLIQLVKNVLCNLLLMVGVDS